MTQLHIALSSLFRNVKGQNMKSITIIFIIIILSLFFICCGEEENGEKGLLEGTWYDPPLPDYQGENFVSIVIDSEGNYESTRYKDGIPNHSNSDVKGNMSFTDNYLTLIHTHKWDTNINTWKAFNPIEKGIVNYYVTDTQMGPMYIREGSGSGLDGTWKKYVTNYTNNIITDRSEYTMLTSGNNAEESATNHESAGTFSGSTKYLIFPASDNVFDFVLYYTNAGITNYIETNQFRLVGDTLRRNDRYFRIN